MALPDSIKLVTGTKIVLAQTADYSPSQGQPARTDGLNLEALATGGNYRQSTKFDLGVNRAPRYSVRACSEYFSAPTAGELGLKTDTAKGGAPALHPYAAGE